MDLKYFDHPRTEMLPFVPAGIKSVIEFGCGAGAFAARLKRERDCEVWGVELEAGASAEAATHLDRVIQADAAASLDELPDHFFDCAVFNNVLEHLRDPEELLKSLRCKLAAGGCVVASISNVRYFFNLWDLVVRGRWEYADEGILDRTNLRFFTRSSLGPLFHRCGYDLESVSGLWPTESRKFRLFNLLALGRCDDMRYLQFACRARLFKTISGAGG